MQSVLHFFNSYNENKGILKSNLFNLGDGNKRIDIHKIIACLMWSLTKVNLITYNSDKRENKNGRVFVASCVLSAKYAVVVLSAMNILHLAVLSKLKDINKTAYNAFLNTTLIFPLVNKGHDFYLKGVMKSLALNDSYWSGKYFDVPILCGYIILD